MVNAKKKGDRGEREVAKISRNWWSKIEKDVDFIKTPMSGGWSTNKVRAHFKACGDIMTTAKKWPFVVEVKRREKWSIKNFLAAKKGPAWNWWVKACKDADDQGGIPMLWLRKNSVNKYKKFPWLIILPKYYVKGRNLSEPDAIWGPKSFQWFSAPTKVPVLWIATNLLRTSPREFLIGKGDNEKIKKKN